MAAMVTTHLCDAPSPSLPSLPHQEVRSATVMTGPQERSLMELKEQTRVLRERLETTQKKNSHLETEIQQHHIRESLRQVGVVGNVVM